MQKVGNQLKTYTRENSSVHFTYKLLLLICWESCHLLFVCLHLLFIVLKVSHCEPRNKMERRGQKWTSFILNVSVFEIILAYILYILKMCEEAQLCEKHKNCFEQLVISVELSVDTYIAVLTCSLWLCVWNHQWLS